MSKTCEQRQYWRRECIKAVVAVSAIFAAALTSSAWVEVLL